MGKIKLASLILSALAALITAAKAIIYFIKCMMELKPKTA